MESPLSQAHAALGARSRTVAGVDLPRHYGDGAAEYEAVRRSVGVVDRSDLAVLRMWGRDPLKMLQGLITNDLAGAPAGRGVYAALLTPKGKAIAELRAFPRQRPDGQEVMLLLPREALEGTREHLKKYVPPMFARWADVSGEVGVVGVYGPASRELLSRVLAAELPDLAPEDYREEGFGSEPVLVARTDYAGGEPGYDVLAAATALPALWDALLAQGADLGVRPVGHGALHTLRVEAGVPRYGSELTEDTIPTEAFESTGLMPRAISFSKGCYTGQEVIVRIAHRGHVNRHLRGLLLGDAPAPAFRTPLFHPESAKEIGWTTSAAVSPLLGQTVALAYVRRELEPGGTVRLGAADGPEVRLAPLPFTTEGTRAGG